MYTNAQIAIDEQGNMQVGSRNRWITPGKQTDNYGFAAWAEEHREELLQLGPGRHFGEWWGLGIQRGYALDEKRFWLFNTFRPADSLPACVGQVPILYQGQASETAIDSAFAALGLGGSVAAPGFMDPEGIVIYRHLTKTLIKRTPWPRSGAPWTQTAAGAAPGTSRSSCTSINGARSWRTTARDTIPAWGTG